MVTRHRRQSCDAFAEQGSSRTFVRVTSHLYSPLRRQSQVEGLPAGRVDRVQCHCRADAGRAPCGRADVTDDGESVGHLVRWNLRRGWRLPVDVAQECLPRALPLPHAFPRARMAEGVAGGFLMGLRHGLFCVGCCWALMVLLFAAGVMTSSWLAHDRPAGRPSTIRGGSADPGHGLTRPAQAGAVTCSTLRAASERARSRLNRRAAETG